MNGGRSRTCSSTSIMISTPTFAAEKLDEIHGLKHDRKTIGAIMIALWLKNRRVRLAQRLSIGIGASQSFASAACPIRRLIYHEWFEDRVAGKQCLLAAIDDATGNIIHLSIKEHEGVLPVLAFWKEYANKYGLPQAIYVENSLDL